MCRLLFINAKEAFEIEEKLTQFAEMAEKSPEYQGDGWGICYNRNGKMAYHHSPEPIWADRLDRFGKSNLMMVHARSAFQDKEKPVEHNMPFHGAGYNFIFNGELRGVRIHSDGRIGAEKIFNYIRRFDRNGLSGAIRKSMGIIERRTDYVRAMNYIMTDSEHVYINSFFNEDREYFTLYMKETAASIHVCSGKLSDEGGWVPIPNRRTIRRRIR